MQCLVYAYLMFSTSKAKYIYIVLTSQSIYKSAMSITFIPFFCSKSANTPLPEISLPEKEPSYIELTPHDGLLDCSITRSTFSSFTIYNAFFAPFLNSLSTEVPSL